MNDPFIIYIDRLRHGHEEEIELEVAPELLDIEEKELLFKNKIKINGSANLVDETLVLNLSIETEVSLPCIICSVWVPVKVNIKNFIHAEEIKLLKSRLFSFKEIVRDSILLELPARVECSESCPERSNLAKYLRN